MHFKPVRTDEQYVTSFICQVHVCICNTFYMTNFHNDKFYLLEKIVKEKMVKVAHTDEQIKLVT
jgi:hypothetical protein